MTGRRLPNGWKGKWRALSGPWRNSGLPTTSGPATTGDEFLRALTDALQAPAGHLGATGQGVFVSSFRTAIGMEFDAVWLVGMIEGGTPPAIHPDPLLPEGYDRSERSSLVSDRAERQAADERYAYLSAISSAPRRVLSFPVADSSARREAHPFPLAVGTGFGPGRTAGAQQDLVLLRQPALADRQRIRQARHRHGRGRIPWPTPWTTICTACSPGTLPANWPTQHPLATGRKPGAGQQDAKPAQFQRPYRVRRKPVWR